jgi:hypothetical protein
MAYGRHWEWRGFGAIPPTPRARLEALPLKFPRAQELVDEYLWVPGAAINVKLRFSNFKLKRLLETRGDCQLWLEDPQEDHPFPVAREVVAGLARELGVSLPRLEQSSYSRDVLLELLASGSPAVRVIAVGKQRWQREWNSDPPGLEESVIVEVAEILSPERTSSVGIEHPTLEGVQLACSALEIGSALRVSSYLEALGKWAAGRSAAAP